MTAVEEPANCDSPLTLVPRSRLSVTSAAPLFGVNLIVGTTKPVAVSTEPSGLNVIGCVPADSVMPADVMSIPVLSNFQSHLSAAVFHITIFSSCFVPSES